MALIFLNLLSIGDLIAKYNLNLVIMSEGGEEVT
jgi:hypothetical protein